MVLVVEDMFEVGLAAMEVGAVVDKADLLMAGGALFEACEVVAFEAEFELASPDDDVRVTVVVSQLVIDTWHCCAAVILGKV